MGRDFHLVRRSGGRRWQLGAGRGECRWVTEIVAVSTEMVGDLVVFRFVICRGSSAQRNEKTFSVENSELLVLPGFLSLGVGDEVVDGGAQVSSVVSFIIPQIDTNALAEVCEERQSSEIE